MKLIVKCNQCRNEMPAPHKAHSRVDYVQKYGEEFKMTCRQCNHEDTYEVDDIRAVDYSFGEILKNRIVVVLVILVATFGLGLFIFGPGASSIMAVVASMIYAVIAKKNDSQANLTFNKHKVKGRISNIGS